MPEATGQDPRETRERILSALESYPTLRRRILQALLITLHSQGVATVDDIHAEARRLAGRERERSGAGDENAPLAERWSELERERVREITIDLAAGALSPDQVDDLVLLARKREEAQSLEEIASLSPVSFRLIADRVRRFCSLPRGQVRLAQRESESVRVALIRHFISDQLEFIGVAKRFLSIRHFPDLLDRIVGDDSGVGRIGGKAAGMFLARCILERAEEAGDPPPVPVSIPESYYLRSDVIEQFLRHQGLQELQDHKYKSTQEIRNEYPMVLQVFKNADFPPAIVEQLRGVLAAVGERPLIVRSSSLLEDRFGTAFAGKYRSVFVPNQGGEEERLAGLLGAIAEVYASTLHPDPISYRRRHNLLDYDENMAALIQPVVGTRIGDYFLPVWAGVAVSRNDFRKSPRVRPEDGAARLVLGLGTRAVDRVANDWPRHMALGIPTLRAEVQAESIRRFSQHEVDLINLRENRLETVELSRVLAQGKLAGLEDVVSIDSGGHLRPPAGRLLLAEPEDMVVTFERFAGSSPFPALLRWALGHLEAAYGCPVDIEFAYDGERFHLLQCRPQARRKSVRSVPVPRHIPEADRIFSASRDVMPGSLHGVEYVVLIDPRDYDRLRTEEERLKVGGVVSRLNERLAGRVFLLLGPGRWGTKDTRMGVRVSYADISNTRGLIEIARARGGYVPEVSFGSHFFQDLAESNILYLALYPDDPESLFNEEFLHGSANRLGELLPEATSLETVVRVIDVRATSGGRLLHVDMDEDAQAALGYLAAD